MPKARSHDKARLIVRQLEKDDLEAVQALQQVCLPGIEPWEREELDQQIGTFPEGQLCVELDGKLIATSSTLLVDEADLDDIHTFDDVSDNGTISGHVPDGDILYGIDIAVDPRHRGMRVARRLYDARKDLARRFNVRAMLIAGRIPGYHEHADAMGPEEYVRKVVRKELKDNVLTAQLSNGFSIRQVLKGYLPSDHESCGCAVFMEWLNDQYIPEAGKVPSRRIRVGAVQYQMRPIDSFDDFAKQCEFFVNAAGDHGVDFLLFPEYLTNQLQSLVTEQRPGLTARRLDEFTERYVDLFSRLTLKYNVNVIAGSHLTVEDGRLYNIAYLFRRDGSVAKQYKLHIPPDESHWWGVSPGEQLQVFDSDRGKIAILVCDDVEIPEIARVARARGANVIFVPFSTDLRSSYWRVRACAQARCIENHLFAVLAGPVGNLPLVQGADIHYGQACILTPSDLPFPRDGLAEEASPNVETMLVHELDLEVLRRTRRGSTVRTRDERRRRLYGLRVRDLEGEHEI